MLSLTPELLVEDIQKTLNWYQATLGFEVLFTSPEAGDPNFSRIIKGSAAIMLYERKEFAKDIPSFASAQVGGSFVLYLEVDNIQEEWSKLKDKATVIQPLHKTPYGSEEFTIQDCNGYHLMFGERS